jgi:hypothetical protein
LPNTCEMASIWYLLHGECVGKEREYELY